MFDEKRKQLRFQIATSRILSYLLLMSYLWLSSNRKEDAIWIFTQLSHLDIYMFKSIISSDWEEQIYHSHYMFKSIISSGWEEQIYHSHYRLKLRMEISSSPQAQIFISVMMSYNALINKYCSDMMSYNVLINIVVVASCL